MQPTAIQKARMAILFFAQTDKRLYYNKNVKLQKQNRYVARTHKNNIKMKLEHLLKETDAT